MLDPACSTQETSPGLLPHFSTHPRHAARALNPTTQGARGLPQRSSDPGLSSLLHSPHDKTPLGWTDRRWGINNVTPEP